MADAPSFASLDPRIFPENVFRSFVKALYDDIDRTSFPESDYFIFYGKRPREEDRKSLKDAKAIIQIVFDAMSGGRGQIPSAIKVRVHVKEDEDDFYNITFPLIHEILRIYERELDFYDFTTNRGTPEIIESAEVLAPVFVQALNEGNMYSDGFETTQLEFDVFADREVAKFDVST